MKIMEYHQKWLKCNGLYIVKASIFVGIILHDLILNETDIF